jgi:hypothetical protein
MKAVVKHYICHECGDDFPCLIASRQPNHDANILRGNCVMQDCTTQAIWEAYREDEFPLVVFFSAPHIIAEGKDLS